MKVIKLTQGKKTLVDDDDYTYLKKWNWYYGGNGYARRWVNGKTVSMHRVILERYKLLNNCECVDHIDGNTLNNIKENLRVVSHHQNMMNKKVRINNASGYKGVNWRKDRNKWQAYITINGKQKHLGTFGDKKEAARAYDKEAKCLFGEYARLNFN